ncbi:hypothetical protein QQ045_005423 [Rhodiola kirilowii]
MSTLSKRKGYTKAESRPKKPMTNALKHCSSTDRGTPAVSFEEKMAAPPGFSRKYSTIPKPEPMMDDITFPSTYKVKEEFTQTAQFIFSKHGDIVVDCLFEGTLRMNALQSTCAIYENLKRSKLSFVTVAELESMRNDVKDLEKARLKVSWLAGRLDEIYEAKLCMERSSLMDEEREKNQQCIETLEKELNLQQQELPAIRLKLEEAKTATILQTFLEAIEKATIRFSWKSSKEGSSSSLNISSSAGYKVKNEFESAAQVIFSNQGDILANCLFESTLRWHLLESACAIYRKMENLSMKDITLAELEAVRRDVHDLEKAKVDVSWVAKGLEDLYKTKKSVESPLFMEELHNNNNICKLENEILAAERRIKEANEKLVAEKARSAILRQNFVDAKKKVSGFFRKSLVDGI